MWTSTTGAVFLSLLVILAALSDARTRRIPNVLTIGGLALALALRGLAGGGPLMYGLAGAGLALLAVFPLLLVGAMGGGDAKLLIAVGAFLGPGRLLLALALTALAGGVLALALLVRRRVILPVLLRTREFVVYCATLGKSGELPPQAEGAVRVPYGLAIAFGALGAWFL